mmetsp:Transcript_5799/g.14910  ORF Transcript_5799/g.14910 Transcript_5799/m.14910 type:complete len:337 (+) Transcript_5799:444-1454(+)
MTRHSLTHSTQNPQVHNSSGDSDGIACGIVQYCRKGCAAKASSILHRKVFEGLHITIGAMEDAGLRFLATRKEVSEANLIWVQYPKTSSAKCVIDVTSEWVKRHGLALENAIAQSELGCKEFSFLHDHASAEHTYYRWKLFTICAAGAEGCNPGKDWGPFAMLQGSDRIWIPPMRPAKPAQGAASDANTADLSSEEVEVFRGLLKHLTLERSTIERTMVYVFERKESALDIVRLLCESFAQQTPNTSLLIARMYLISDILHNSLNPESNASSLHSLLEKRLPEIFESVHRSFELVPSRIEKEAFRKRILAILRAWGNWIGSDKIKSWQQGFVEGSR